MAITVWDDPTIRQSIIQYSQLYETKWPVHIGPTGPEIITKLWRELNTGMYGKSGINVDVYNLATLLTHIQDLEKEITRLVCERNF
ncbi:hypothetical protein [Rhizobium phage RHph_X3_15]|nr:hypothetical protein [Rhizobium phage RHph_X3_15]